MIAGITRDDVLEAVEEADRVGAGFFAAWHGFGRGAYKAVIDGVEVDSKAVVGVAARRLFGRELRPAEFSGGAMHSAGLLVRLGFEVRYHGELLAIGDLPRRLVLRPRSAPLRLYVCQPTSKSSIAACYEHNFGTLLSPLSVDTVKVKDGEPKRFKLRDMSGRVQPLADLPYVLDNGVWSCHQANFEWSDEPFLRLLSRFAHRDVKPSFVVAPDIVAAGEESLEFSLRWLKKHRSSFGALQWLLAVQDGMTVARVREVLLEQRLAGIFVGGSAGKNTPNWKWLTLHRWADLGHELGLRVHVGRVNGQRRAQLCNDLGVASIDGSMISRYAQKKAGLMAKPCDGLEQIPGIPSSQLRFKLSG